MSAYRWDFEVTGADKASKMASAMNRMSKTSAALTPALLSLRLALERLNTAIQPLENGFIKAAESAKIFRSAIQPLIRYTEKHKEGVSSLSAASAKLSTASKDLSGSIKQQTNTVQNNQKYVGSTVTVINNYERAVKSASGANKDFHGGLLNTLGAWNTINKAWEFGCLRLSQLRDNLTSVFRQTQKFGGEFEQAEKQLSVYVNAGESKDATQQFRDIVKEAERIGADTSASAADAVRASIDASKAGVKRENIKDALAAIMNVSIGEHMNAGRVAEIGAITSSQFESGGLGKDANGKEIVNNITNALKLLQAAASAGSTDIQQLNESFKNAASGASLLKMPMTEASAILNVLAGNAQIGGMAGTKMMQMFSRMSKQTPAATRALKELGVTFIDARGDVLPFASIIDSLKVKLADVQGNAKRISYLKDIFGEGFSAAGYLIEKGGDSIRQKMEEILKSTNVGEDLKNASMTGMLGAFQAYQGSYEQVYNSLRKTLTVPITQYWLTLADALNSVSTRLSSLGDYFDKINTETKNPVDAWLKILETADFTNIFSGLTKEFAKEIAVLRKIASGVLTLIKSMFRAIWKEINTEKVMTTVTTAIGKFGGTLFKSLFTTENMASATKFGIDLGKQIIAGLSQSTTGMMALVLGGATIGGDILSKHAGRFTKGGNEALSNGVLKLQSIVVGSIIAGELINQAVNSFFGGKDAKQDARGVRETNTLLTKLYVALGKTDNQAKRTDILQRIAVQEEELKKQTGSYSPMKTQRERWENARAAKAAASTPTGKMQAAGLSPEQIQRTLEWGKEYQAVGGNKAKWLESTTTWDKETRILQLQALDPLITALQANAIATREEAAVKKAEYGRWAKGEQTKYKGSQRTQINRVVDVAQSWSTDAINKAQAATGGISTKQAALEKAEARRLLEEGYSKTSATYINEMNGVGGSAAMGMSPEQYLRYQAAYAKAKANEGKNRMAEPQTQAEIDAALERLNIEKQIYDLKKRETETEAQISNAPIDLAMQQNETNTSFSKWLMEPINKFTEAISGVIGKFMSVFEGLGKQRVEAGQKSGRLDEEGAKKESAAVLEDSVSRAEKMLQLAQTPGQKAEALQTQAEKLMEMSDLTGDKSKAQRADELLRRAQGEQGKQEDIEIKKVELDRKLAQDNMKLLEGKRDGSASEAVARLQQLMEAATSLGDVQKASEYKQQLQAAERQASGEQVGVLKMILQELQLQRKSSDLQMKEQNSLLQQNNDKQLSALTGIQNSGGYGFDPSLLQPV